MERVPLANHTNTCNNKRSAATEDEQVHPKKKLRRLERTPIRGEDAMDRDEQTVSAPLPNPSGSTYRMMSAMASGRIRRAPLPTVSVLQSLVSSNKADLYRFHATGSAGYIRANGMAPGCAAAFSHGAKRAGKEVLAVGTEEGCIQILDTSKRDDWTAEPERVVLEGVGNAVFDVQWRTDDQRLAAASGEVVLVYDVDKRTTIATLSGHEGTVKTSAWDPGHADLLSTAGRDGCIHLWDLRETAAAPVMILSSPHQEKRTSRKKATCPKSTVTSLCYLPGTSTGSSSQIVSSGSNDGILKKWDIRFKPRGKRFKYAADSIEESLEDPTLLNQGSRRARGILSLAVSGTTIYGLAADSAIYAYSAATLAPLAAVRPPLSHPRLITNSFYYSIAVSPCGRWLASGGIQGRAYVFDIAAWPPSAPGAAPLPSQGVEIVGHEREVSAVDWASNGTLVTCSDDATVRVWRPDGAIAAKCRAAETESRWSWAWAT